MDLSGRKEGVDGDDDDEAERRKRKRRLLYCIIFSCTQLMDIITAHTNIASSFHRYTCVQEVFNWRCSFLFHSSYPNVGV
jgi:hypothetical protein